MEKINVAELLKDCPKGMEFNCTNYNGVVQLNRVMDDNSPYPIEINVIYDNECNVHTLTKYGQTVKTPYNKCIIFPKGKTTWEGFHRPFNPGDIVITDHNEHAFIYSGENDNYWECYCGVYCGTRDLCVNSKQWSDKKHKLHLATEEEKEKLIQVIKDNGYEWNEETKTLEKLVEPRFHVGAWVVFNNQPEKGSVYQIKNTHNYEYTLQHILGGSMSISFSKVDMLRLWTIDDAKEGDVVCYKDEISLYKRDIKNCTKPEITFGGFVYYCCYDGKRFIMDSFYYLTEQDKKNIHPATKEQRDFLFQKIKEAGYYWNDETKTLEKLIQPIFKAGNKVRNKNNHNIVFTITSIEEDYYGCGASKALWFDDQDKYELVPDKFDITTLKPFDKVLVRDNDQGRWDITFYELYDNINISYPYRTLGGMIYKRCIPYKGNEHLMGLVKDCDAYYNTWNN